MGEQNTVTKTAPEHIWLQHSDSDLDIDSPFPESHDGISWCAEQVFQADVEYTRSDLLATLKRQRDMLLEALKLVLPLAKGYAAANLVGSNAEYIRIAEVAIVDVEGSL